MDYSPYYCKNFYKDRRKKTDDMRTDSTPPQNPAALPPPSRHNEGKPYRGRRKKQVFFSFVLVILCFAIVFASADLFSGGAVMETLKETFGSDHLDTHYFVAKGVYTLKTKAEAEAVAVRENGGAGYLYNTGSGYYVILYSFDNRKTAETAKGTDSSLEIIEINVRKPEEDGLTDAQKTICEDALKLITGDIESLYAIIASLSTGALAKEAALDTLTGMRNDLLNKKEELIISGIAAGNAYLNILEPLFGGLDAIVYNKPEHYFVEAVRYVQIGAIIAFPKA